MAFTHNTSYVSQGLNRLLQQFKGKPRITALLTAWLNEVQELEDAIWDTYYDRLLQNTNVTADMLAQYGILVGQGSEGLDDATFKLLILARIKANNSDGTINNLVELTKILEPDSTVHGQEKFPATFYIQVDQISGVPPSLILLSFLGRAVAAGVRIVFVFSPEPDHSTLQFGSYYGIVNIPPPPTLFQSPGSYYATPVGGGLFASVQQA